MKELDEAFADYWEKTLKNIDSSGADIKLLEKIAYEAFREVYRKLEGEHELNYIYDRQIHIQRHKIEDLEAEIENLKQSEGFSVPA